ncbi:MAG: LPS export ABC transporter permease LptG [Wenzhouxiangellaceae bacterium]|nr:LPS export ABC transporter permease LptG [Wenzhouxiangellaceae bacterium]
MSLITRYLLDRLARGYGVMLVAVGSLLWIIALLDRLGQSDGASFATAALQALLQLPVDLIDMLPVVAVLATATVLAAMQAQREITVIRAAGVSLLTVTRVALLPGVVVALAALLALQFLAPVLYQSPQGTAAGGVGENSLWHPWHGLWVRSEREVMNVGRFESGELPGAIDLYRFNADGTLDSQVRAEQAVPAPGTWVLEDVTIKHMDPDVRPRIEQHERWEWSSFLSERQLELFRRPPASLPLTDLWTYVESLKARDLDASEFELVLWRRMALPVACIGMVLIAAAIAARPMKRGNLSVRVTLATGLGLGYHLLSGMAGFFGLVANLSPVVVSVLPPLLLLGAAGWLLAKCR